MNKQKRTQVKYISTFMLMLLLLVAYSVTAFAANEDPGAGRLSGKKISNGFYDTYEEYPLLRAGDSFSKSDKFTKKTYSHDGKFSNRTLVTGIDVSQWNGNINWKKVKAAGIDYAFIRVGYRGYGSGTLNDSTMDPYFDTNMKNATAAGVKVGVYVFSQAISTTEAKQEANYILNRIGKYEISMPLVMDYEYASDSSTGGRLMEANLSKSKATKICNTFCKVIADAGYTPMIYANKSMLETQLNPSDITKNGYRIWLANYTTDTSYAGDYDFWQYSSTGSVKGITGNVDMNFYYKQSRDSFNPQGISITRAEISKVSKQIYTGNKLKPSVTVTYDNEVLVKGQDYNVSYSNNKYPGQATIKISGIGSFSGTKEINFIIAPAQMKKPSIKKKGTDYLKLKWTEAIKVTGYQIYRSEAIDGKYTKLKTIKSGSTTSFTDKNVKPGTYYYYKIRSYAKINGKTYYGEFSTIRTTYTKLDCTRNVLAKKDTTVYTSNSAESEPICDIKKGDILPAKQSKKDMNGNTWYIVSIDTEDDTVTGYVLAKCVTVMKEGTIVNASKVNVRESYSTDSSKITTLKKDTVVNVIKTKSKKGTTWYRVTFEKKGKTYVGWISSPYIKC